MQTRVDFQAAARFNIAMRIQRAVTWSLVLSLVGIGLAGYLTVLHLGLMRGELLGGAACGTSGAFNCHMVAGSSWGSFLGMPLSLWGLLGYVGVFALALLARQSPDWAAHAMTLSAGLAALFVAIDLLLFGVMVVVIRALCLFCLVTYAVNLLLAVIAWRALQRPWPQIFKHLGPSCATLVPSSQRPAAWLFWGIITVGVIGVSGVHAATTFVSRGSLGSIQPQLREYLGKQTPLRLELTGDPVIGPSQAALQIVEFSDFFCPACQRASQLNTIILAGHRRDAVFIFKHYPLDTSCNDRINRMVHPGACQVAAASECAHLQGTFWPFHDRLFAHGRSYQVERLEADAAQLDLDLPRFRACMASGEGLAAVKRDIAEGARVGVSSTPTYVINGVPATGGFNPAMFEAFVAALRETGG